MLPLHLQVLGLSNRARMRKTPQMAVFQRPACIRASVSNGTPVLSSVGSSQQHILSMIQVDRLSPPYLIDR